MTIPAAGDWPEVSLGDVCEFKYGRSLPENARAGGSVPVFGSNGVIGTHNEALTAGPTIVVGRKGSLGEVNYSPEACWPIDTTYYIDGTATRADLRWLAYRLAAIGLTQLNRAAAVPGLNRDDAYRRRVLLPPLPEQKRIAGLLDRAVALRAKRRASLAQLDSLIESIFMDMFGDLDTQDWPMATVADVALPRPGSIRTGPFGSQLLHSEFVESGVAVLGIDNAVENVFRWSERRFISEAKYRELRRYTVHPGDVLITIMGTVGRCAIVPDDVPTAINTKHLCCITLDPQKCLPLFLHAYFLRHPLARRYLARTAKGAIMAGLNMEIIKAMPIPRPPIELQSDFGRRARSVDQLKAEHLKSLNALDNLFASLQYRAFLGEL